MLRLVVLLCFASVALAKVEQYRIVNGQQVGELRDGIVFNPGEFPFLVHLIIKVKNSETQQCGGSIIRNDVILTAADCVRRVHPAEITAVAGIVNIAAEEEGSQIRKIDRIKLHDGFKKEPLENSIALLFLIHPFVITDYVKVAPLTNFQQATDMQTGTAVGWGLNENGDVTNWLHKTEMKLYPSTVCKYFANVKLTEYVNCAWNKRNASTCIGDTGGPFVYDGSIAGIITSILKTKQLPSGKTTCDINTPTAVTLVYLYKDWVNQQIDLHYNRKCTY